MQVEQITSPEAEHAEGPVWWQPWGGLCWVDMLRGDVLRLGRSGSVDRWHVGSIAATMRPHGLTGMVIATEREFVLASEFGADVRRLATAFDDSETRFNEGACDPQGNFWCGTMRYDAAPGGGALYRLSPAGFVVPVFRGVTVSNGLCWSPDGRSAYYVDTPTSRVDVFDHDPVEGLHHRRQFVAIDTDDGSPDGLTVDAEGGVWVAMWSGGALRRFGPDGRLTEVVDLPVAAVTSCAFGGPGLSDLFVTTSRYGDPDPAPAAGAVFRLEPGVTGLPVHPYAG